MNAQAGGFFSKLSRRTPDVSGQLVGSLDSDRARLMCKSFEELGLGALWITDDEGRLTYLSENAASLLVAEGEYKGLAICDLFNVVEEAESARSLLPFLVDG
jgi:hypothetical protein